MFEFVLGELLHLFPSDINGYDGVVGVVICGWIFGHLVVLCLCVSTSFWVSVVTIGDVAQRTVYGPVTSSEMIPGSSRLSIG